MKIAWFTIWSVLMRWTYLATFFHFVLHWTDTGKGRLSEKSYLKEGGIEKHHHDAQTMSSVTYKVKLHVDSHFGTPRAFVIQNNYKKRFFLQSASIDQTCTNRIVHFDCNSWIYPIKKTKSDRLFFSNRVSPIIWYRNTYMLACFIGYFVLPYMK